MPDMPILNSDFLICPISIALNIYIADRKHYSIFGCAVLGFLAPVISTAAIMLVKSNAPSYKDKEIQIYQKRQKFSNMNKTDKTVAVIAAAFVVIMMLSSFGMLITNIRQDMRQQSFFAQLSDLEVGTGESGGSGLLSCSTETGEYSYKYIPDEYAAETRADIGGIVKYKIWYKESGATYNATGSGLGGKHVEWELQNIEVSIIERGTGKVLHTNNFDMEVPGVIDSNEGGGRLYVSEERVTEWISKVWQDYIGEEEKKPG